MQRRAQRPSEAIAALLLLSTVSLSLLQVTSGSEFPVWSRIRGRIWCPDGQPAAGAKLVMYDSDSFKDEEMGKAMSDGKGHFDITGTGVADDGTLLWDEGELDIYLFLKSARCSDGEHSGVNIFVDGKYFKAHHTQREAGTHHHNIGVRLSSGGGQPNVWVTRNFG